VPGRSPEFRAFAVQIVPAKTSRYVLDKTTLISVHKVLYRTLL